MKFVTASTFTKLSALQGLDEAARARVVDDAGALERHVAENEWIDEDSLRKHAEQLGLDPDRTTAALAFLQETDRVVGIAATEQSVEELATGE